MSPLAQRASYVEGNFAPVTEEVSAVDLEVTGTLPAELTGRYLRIGPNPRGPLDPADHHWFLGEGMVHGVRLRDGRAEWYRNRRVLADGHSPNTNVVAHAGRLLALVEAGGVPVSLTHDLAEMAVWDCDGTLAGGYAAHPKVDRATGEMHAVCHTPMCDVVRHVVLDARGSLVHTAEVPLPGRPMVHDIALTASQVVLLDLPVTLSLETLQRMPGATPYSVDRFPYRWDPEHAPRVGLLPRRGSAHEVRWFDASSCYVFHVLGGYDRPDGSVVVDVVRYDTVFRDELRAPADSPPALARWTIHPDGATVGEEVITDRSVEFPRTDPALVGRPHRYGWFSGFGQRGLVLSDDVTRSRVEGFETGPLVKVDTLNGETTVHDLGPGRVSMEPAFVPRPGAVAEDDGWILSVVHDATLDRSELVVLDAGDLAAAPVARVHLPQRVPLGFHGNWVDDAELAEPVPHARTATP